MDAPTASGESVSRRAPVGEVTHLSRESCRHPLVIKGAVLGRDGSCHPRQFETSVARQFADVVLGQISSPTCRISSIALLLRTTPGRIW